jgi:hypothetical protein
MNLMRRYPQLKSQLGELYAGVRTRPQTTTPNNSYQPADPRRIQALQDKSDEHALRLMMWAQKSNTPDGDAVKEFVTLITSLTAGRQEENG